MCPKPIAIISFCVALISNFVEQLYICYIYASNYTPHLRGAESKYTCNEEATASDLIQSKRFLPQTITNGIGDPMWLTP